MEFIRVVIASHLAMMCYPLTFLVSGKKKKKHLFVRNVNPFLNIIGMMPKLQLNRNVMYSLTQEVSLI